MPLYGVPTKDDLMAQALSRIAQTTPLTAVNTPGSVIRAIVEVIVSQISNAFNLLDFNLSQALLSQATGRSLDLIGQIYNVTRRVTTDLAAQNQDVGAFYFYIDSPSTTAFTVPAGTIVSTVDKQDLGPLFQFQTIDDAVFSAGRTRVFATLRPTNGVSSFSAGPNTLTLNSFNVGTNFPITVKSTNPKPVSAEVGLETDDSYRARIIKSVRVNGGGTTEAVRYAGLSVPGVRDITVRTAPYGLGSFEVIVLPEDNTLSDVIVDTVRIVIDRVRPVGSRMYLTTPQALAVDVSAQLSLRNVQPATSLDLLQNRARNAVLRYLNSLLVGSPLVYSQLLDAVIQASEIINDVTFTTLNVNGRTVLRRNYLPNSNQILIPGSISVSTV